MPTNIVPLRPLPSFQLPVAWPHQRVGIFVIPRDQTAAIQQLRGRVDPAVIEATLAQPGEWLVFAHAFPGEAARVCMLRSEEDLLHLAGWIPWHYGPCPADQVHVEDLLPADLHERFWREMQRVARREMRKRGMQWQPKLRLVSQPMHDEASKS